MSCGRPIVRAAVLFAATLAGGCTVAAPTTDRLVVTTRSASSAGAFDLRLFDWRRGRLEPVGQFAVEGAAEPPQILGLSRDGAVVYAVRRNPEGPLEVRRGHAQRAGAAPPPTTAPQAGSAFEFEGVAFDRLLDSGEGLVLVARDSVRRGEPAMRVQRGIIQSTSPTWQRLFVIEIDTGRSRPVSPLGVRPICRLGPLEWLMLTEGDPPAIERLDAVAGRVESVAPWSTDRHIASAAVSPGGRRAVLSVQRVGQSWTLFDLYGWDRSGGLRLVFAEALVANRPRAGVAPTLPLYFINERHLAFVTTLVSEWRARTPIEGTYQTAILDLDSGEVLCRIRNPQRSLRNTVPPPYLPDGRLAGLRIERTNPAAAGGGFSEEGAADEGWRRFLAFRNGRLHEPGGQSFEPSELGGYAYSSDGRVLAVRRRAGGNEGRDEVRVMTTQRLLEAIALPGVVGLKWAPNPGESELP